MTNFNSCNKCFNCNSFDHEPGATFCHFCGAQLTGQPPKDNGGNVSTELLEYGKKIQNSLERLRERQQYEDGQQVSGRSKVLRYCTEVLDELQDDGEALLVAKLDINGFEDAVLHNV